MNKLRAAAPLLEQLVPYDPKYLPADAYLSANENAYNPEGALREAIAQAIAKVSLNRYPDPLANGLRERIAQAYDLEKDWVLVGNGGDELLFNLALAWGGPGRAFLNFPPTFSSYEANALLTGTTVIEVPRKADWSIDEEAALAIAASGDVDLIVVTSPNNPTGACAPDSFLRRLLEATDALILVDEAYAEFAEHSLVDWLPEHKNLVILRTFSKAYGLAGVRLGYVLAHPEVITELVKVRQPYSVDSVSQAIGEVIMDHREEFAPRIAQTIAERETMAQALSALAGVTVYPSEANYLLISVPQAAQAWEYLYEQGILVRDFSSAPYLEGHLRVSVGTPEENQRFLKALEEFLDTLPVQEG